METLGKTAASSKSQALGGPHTNTCMYIHIHIHNVHVRTCRTWFLARVQAECVSYITTGKLAMCKGHPSFGQSHN